MAKATKKATKKKSPEADYIDLEDPVEAAGCKCCDQVNVQLKDMGLALDRSIMMNFSKGEAKMGPPQIMLKVVNGSPKNGRKGQTLFCAYCPFCGKKYE